MLLLKASRYFHATRTLHPYLQHNLKSNKLLPLRNIQLKTFQTSQNQHNIFLNQSDGSGKTLAYLIPIINQAVSSKMQKVEPSKAIIVTLNKQLSLQIYQQIRKLDPKKVLNVNRSGSIIHYSSVIDEMSKPSKQQDNDLIVDLMNKNVTDSVNWAKTDILVTTPKLFYRIVDAKKDERVEVVPKYFVLDQADIILAHNDLLNYVDKGLENIQIMSAKKKMSTNYILVSPHKTFMGQLKETQIRMPKFQEFSRIQTENENNIVKNLKIRFVQINQSQKQQIKNQKIALLIKIITQPQRKRCVVYCQKANIDAIKTAISQLPDIIPSQIYASLSTQKRMLSLFNFIECKSNLLITTDVTSRGINFGKEIDTIISFDMGDREEQVSRLSRSNKLGGQYIIMGSKEQRNKVQNLLSKTDQQSQE